MWKMMGEARKSGEQADRIRLGFISFIYFPLKNTISIWVNLKVAEVVLRSKVTPPILLLI